MLFRSDKATLLAQLAEGLDGEHLWWLSGYIAGLARAGQAPARTLHLAAAEATTDTGTPATLTIVYGSQTGNAKRLAETLAQQARDAGIAVRLLRADAYSPRELKQERHLDVVISTQGDGAPPDAAPGLVDLIPARPPPAPQPPGHAPPG